MTQKLDKRDFMFMDKKGDRLIKASGAIQGKDFVLDGCEDCEIFLQDHVAQLFIDYCKRCTIVTGCVSSSAFLRNCENCRFKVICGQLRTRDCVDCDLMVLVPGQPIIETSHGMRFGPLLTCYSGFEKDMLAAGLLKRFEEGMCCQWQHVYDFSPDQPTGKVHWSCLSKDEAERLSSAFPGAPVGEVPVNLKRDLFPEELLATPVVASTTKAEPELVQQESAQAHAVTAGTCAQEAQVPATTNSAIGNITDEVNHVSRVGVPSGTSDPVQIARDKQEELRPSKYLSLGCCDCICHWIAHKGRLRRSACSAKPADKMNNAIEG